MMGDVHVLKDTRGCFSRERQRLQASLCSLVGSQQVYHTGTPEAGGHLNPLTASLGTFSFFSNYHYRVTWKLAFYLLWAKVNSEKPIFSAWCQLSQLKDTRYPEEDRNAGRLYTGQEYIFRAQHQHLLKAEPLPDSHKKGVGWRQALFSLPHPSVINAWFC